MSDSYRFGPSGFGGWLIVLVVAQVAQMLLSSLVALGSLFAAERWIESGGFLLFLFEVGGNAACAVAAGLMLKLMLNRSPEFISRMPRVWSATCGFIVLEPGVQGLLTGDALGRTYSVPVMLVCALCVLWTAGWIFYVQSSERVGNTFEEPEWRFGSIAQA